MTATPGEAEHAIAAQPHEPHRADNWLRDVILGGQDGLVNVLGIVLGATAAGAQSRILIATALAATFAEAISMGAVAYTSSLAERDHYLSELEREKLEMQTIPDEERREIHAIYREKGFDGPLLEQIVDHITSDPEIWLKTMMSEELHLEEVNTRDVLRTSVIVTIAAIIGGLIPLAPFIVVPDSAIWVAVVLSAIALFAVGAYKAKSLVGDWRKSGLQMVLIGLGAAVAGFVVGRIFGAAGA
jgi:VIT1/CCC1 family predicted Fe2+/Mn2+ transporter